MSQATVKPKTFCKLFETTEYGQVLCVREMDHEEDRPSITFMAQAPHMNGLGTLKAHYDTDEEADNNFSELTEEMALKVGKSFYDMGRGTPNE